ncbi:MAG TPA: hypothetical protein VEY94_12225 [Patescibacteria group bacterium]|nr:hypothetical protein [Patescibacteria group bacterium]
MKALTVMIVAIALATGTAFAGKTSSNGGYFYVKVGIDTDSDGDARLVASPTFATQAACTTAAASETSLLQGCVAHCNGGGRTVYYVEQTMDSDSDDPTTLLYQTIGPYGAKPDCQTAIADATAAGMTDVLPGCLTFTSPCR